MTRYLGFCRIVLSLAVSEVYPFFPSLFSACVGKRPGVQKPIMRTWHFGHG